MRRSTKLQSEAEKVIEQMRKIINDFSVKQNILETENRALKNTILELQKDNDDMKTELTELQTTRTTMSSTVIPTLTATRLQPMPTTTAITTEETTTSKGQQLQKQNHHSYVHVMKAGYILMVTVICL